MEFNQQISNISINSYINNNFSSRPIIMCLLDYTIIHHNDIWLCLLGTIKCYSADFSSHYPLLKNKICSYKFLTHKEVNHYLLGTLHTLAHIKMLYKSVHQKYDEIWHKSKIDKCYLKIWQSLHMSNVKTLWKYINKTNSKVGHLLETLRIKCQ